MKLSLQSRLSIGVSLAGLALAAPLVSPVTAQQLAGATAPSQPWAHEASDIPVDRDIRFGLLPNGLRYAIMHNATPKGKSSLWLRIDAGSLMEKEDQRGLAHFMEHMAFNGTENIPENELIHKLQRLGLQFGADLNAGTTFDQTFYRLDMPKNDEESIDTGLHVLREQVSAALMDPKAIDEERGVVQGEDRLRNSPANIIGLKLFDAMGAGTLLPKRMPIGDMEVIRTAPRERFVEYYQQYYRPSRATVVAVGDFDVDAMEAKIKAQFADWKPRAADGAEPELGQIVPHSLETHAFVEPTLSPSVSINWIRAPENKPDTLANRRDDVVSDLVIAVLNRRLGETSRTDNPPFLSAQGSGQEAYRTMRMASISGTFVKGKWSEALSGIDRAARQLTQYGVSEAELNREINSRRTSYQEAAKAASTRNTVNLAGQMVFAVNNRTVSTSPATDLEIFESAVKGLTAEKASMVAKTIFAGEGPIVSLMSPDPVAGGDLALREAYDASVKLAVAPQPTVAPKSWAYTDFGTPGKVVSTSRPDLLGATTYTFANGVKLSVKHVDFDKNQISVGLLTGIGERNFSPDKIDPRAVALGAVTSGGLGRMTVDEVTRAFNGKRVGAGLSTLGQRFLLSGGTRPEDLQLQMQYMAAIMTDPALRSNEFDKAIASAPIGWTLAHSSPDGVFGVEGNPLISGGDQRVAFAPPEVTNSWKLEPLRDDIRRMIASGPIHIVIAGDMNLDDAVKAVASTFGALPPRPDYNAPAPGSDRRSFGTPNKDPVLFTHNGLKDQSLGSVTWQTSDVIGKNGKLSRQLSVLKSVMQLRANDIIREKEALAYSPRVSEFASPDYAGFGTLQSTAATSPDKLPAFYAAIDGIVTDLQANPIGIDELKRAREPMIEHSRQSLKTNYGWFRLMLGAAYEPGSVDDALKDIEVYEAVTPQLIQQLARQYLAIDKAIRISVVPSSEAKDSSELASSK